MKTEQKVNLEVTITEDGIVCKGALDPLPDENVDPQDLNDEQKAAIILMSALYETVKAFMEALDDGTGDVQDYSTDYRGAARRKTYDA